MTPALAAAQSAGATARTPWGDPDIQGVWDYRTLTPLERPEELGDKAFLTEEEAAELERETLARNEFLLNRPAETTTAADQVCERADGTPGFYNNFWTDRGTTAIGTRRTSLIIEPSNGRLPPLTAPAARRAASAEAARIREVRRGMLPAASYTDLDAGDRCIQHAKAGPPLSRSGYNNNVQIFQAPGYVVLVAEQNREARIVPLDGRPLLSSGENLRLVERLTRIDAENLMYEYTVDDPTIWTSAWTAQHPIKLNPEPLYEFACHEGNYGLHGILAGSRAEEAEAAAASKQ